MIDTETIPCRICSKPTPMLGTKLCDRCWELEGRIRRDPQLAVKILKSLHTCEECGWMEPSHSPDCPSLIGLKEINPS